MLNLLKESVQSKHAERLEQIVIALIAVEIGVFTVPHLHDLAFIHQYLLSLGVDDHIS